MRRLPSLRVRPPPFPGGTLPPLTTHCTGAVSPLNTLPPPRNHLARVHVYHNYNHYY